MIIELLAGIFHNDDQFIIFEQSLIDQNFSLIKKVFYIKSNKMAVLSLTPDINSLVL